MSPPRSADGKTPSTPTPTGPTFSAVDTAAAQSLPVSGSDLVKSPSLSSTNALARFEFEPGKSRNATKVLMVEWEDDETTRDITGDWAISWESKKTVLPAKDVADGGVNRLYFLLPGSERVPATVTLTLTGTPVEKDASKAQQRQVVWRTNPLPAIFPPELGASAREAGKKGVLHTIWAKRRLQVLSKEIEDELQSNAEGIGLEMAIQEREWIESNFAVQSKPANITIPNSALLNSPDSQHSLATIGLNSPQSPRSPGGSRLMDKLKGLKLETSGETTSQREPNPLSPEQSDVAVSSFGTFAALKGMPEPKTLAAKSAQPPQQQQATRRIAAQRPPDSLLQQQQQRSMGMGSLNAFAGNGNAHTGFSAADREDEKEEGLFALPMSPRTPADKSRSPFSFGVEETMRYSRGERV